MYLCLVIWLDENSHSLGILNFGEKLETPKTWAPKNFEAPSYTINPFQQILFASMKFRPIFRYWICHHQGVSLQNPPTFYMVDFWFYFKKTKKA